MAVTADDLDLAVSVAQDSLTPGTDRDWLVAQGTGDWTARNTAEHLGDCLLSYAGQLVATPADRYVRFAATADQAATPAELLEFAVMGGRILASVVRTSPPTTRAFHPTGRADPEGFAAMGCVEVLIHGHDLARGLGLDLVPPPALCANVIARMFPHSTASLTDVDPWTALLWATDRVEIPGLPSQQGWRWRGAPLDA